ncbi:MAG: glycosyltransferase family 4 protein [Geobacter sp.]|nr:glycosyltransferase family 4 protein [Geobacter sp.]
MVQPLRCLILSYFTKIDGMACAQHIDDRIPYLVEAGIEPVMLSGVCGGDWRGMTHVKAFSLAPSGIRFELRHLRKLGGMVRLVAVLLNLLILPLYLLEKLLIDLDSQWSWFPVATLKGYRICNRHQPKVIYSTGGPASTHLAAALIASRYRIPWVAEFQDPLVHDDWLRSKRALKVYTWLERFICSRADAVIFLTDRARKNANSRTNLGERGHVIYPGADPGTMPQIDYERGSCFRIAHFGSLGGSRNLKVFLEALQQLLAERPEMAAFIRLDLYGSCDPLSRQAINAFPLPDIIHDYGRVPRSESLVAMKRCDLLLLVQNTEKFSSETIPSKTYEYLHTGRPILGLVYHNPELEQMLMSLGHTAVAADSTPAVKQAIFALCSNWNKVGQSCQSQSSPFTVESAANHLLTVVAASGEILSGDKT